MTNKNCPKCNNVLVETYYAHMSYYVLCVKCGYIKLVKVAKYKLEDTCYADDWK